MNTGLPHAAAAAEQPTHTPTMLSFKGRVAVIIGNWLEFYDFLVFTFFAVMIGDAFFPGESAIGRLLGALATFGAGVLTRPLGAVLIGAYADRVGRRAALTLTLLLMASGSAVVALTPSFAQKRSGSRGSSVTHGASTCWATPAESRPCLAPASSRSRCAVAASPSANSGRRKCCRRIATDVHQPGKATGR